MEGGPRGRSTAGRSVCRSTAVHNPLQSQTCNPTLLPWRHPTLRPSLLQASRQFLLYHHCCHARVPGAAHPAVPSTEATKSMQPAKCLLFGRHALGGDSCHSDRPFRSMSLEASAPLYKQLTPHCMVALQQVVSHRQLRRAIMVRMRDLKRKRVDAPRVPTLEDVHPHTTWSMCVRVYHKFHVERFAIGRKRLSMVLLDEKGKKMVAVIYDDQVERFDRLLVEGRVYYVRRMSAEPVKRNQDYRFAGSHYVCCFTSQTVVHEIRTMTDKDELIPLFASFMPLGRVWQFTMNNDMYVDVIGMVLYVSSVGFKDTLDNRRIPFRNICLMDGSFNIVKLVLWDKSLTDNLVAWEKSASRRAIVVATMLWANCIGHSVETRPFSRVHFDPDIPAAHELRRRINNDLTGHTSS